MIIQKLRDIMVILTCLWTIILTMTIHLNPIMVAEWKIQVDDAYWTLYEENCADRCVGD